MLLLWASASCLNPSFSGIWSRIAESSRPGESVTDVLILLLLEYGLGLYCWDSNQHDCNQVLILLLVEYGLGSLTAEILEKNGLS